MNSWHACHRWVWTIHWDMHQRLLMMDGHSMQSLLSIWQPCNMWFCSHYPRTPPAPRQRLFWALQLSIHASTICVPGISPTIKSKCKVFLLPPHRGGMHSGIYMHPTTYNSAWVAPCNCEEGFFFLRPCTLPWMVLGQGAGMHVLAYFRVGYPRSSISK